MGNEWLWIFLIALVLFGGSQIPKLFRGMGQGIREFKAAAKELNVTGDENTPPEVESPPEPEAAPPVSDTEGEARSGDGK